MQSRVSFVTFHLKPTISTFLPSKLASACLCFYLQHLASKLQLSDSWNQTCNCMFELILFVFKTNTNTCLSWNYFCLQHLASKLQLSNSWNQTCNCMLELKIFLFITFSFKITTHRIEPYKYMLELKLYL